MKPILAALAALLTLGAAQAVSLTWQTGADNSVYNSGAGGARYFAASGATTPQNVSFAALVTLDSTSGAYASDGKSSTSIFNIGMWSAGNIQGYTYGGNNAFSGRVGIEKTGDNLQDWADSVSLLPTMTAGEQYLFTVTISRDENNIPTFVCYMNGTKIFEEKDPKGAANLNVQTFDTDQWTIDATAAYDGVLSAEQVGWLAEHDTVVLPEPTALALLAFGVAGLALRRRAA